MGLHSGSAANWRSIGEGTLDLYVNNVIAVGEFRRKTISPNDIHSEKQDCPDFFTEILTHLKHLVLNYAHDIFVKQDGEIVHTGTKIHEINAFPSMFQEQYLHMNINQQF